MPTHRRGRLVTGAIATVVALVLLALPAAAGTANVTITSGALGLRTSGGSSIKTINLANPGTSCTAPAKTVTTTGNDIAATIGLHFVLDVAPQFFAVSMTISMTGLWSGTAPTYNVAGGTSITATAFRTATATSCTPISAVCNISVANITWSGQVDSANINSLATTDEVLWAGTSPAFSAAVNGACGMLVAFDDGSVSFTGVTLHVP
jgi:hypothetical protein